jgi:hypothetical protein
LIDVYSQFRLVSGIYGKEISDLSSMEPTASLGSEQLFLTEEEKTMSSVQVGFALSSPTLKLCGGLRSVRLYLYFSAESIDHLTFLLLDIANKRTIKPEEVFHEVFAYAFSIALTGENDWISPNTYQIIPPVDWTKDPITLTFELNESAPAIMPYNTAVHGGNYHTEHPVLRILMSGG